MKVIVIQDKWYPCYSIYSTDIYDKDNTIEIKESFFEKYKKCMKEFREIQKILEKKYELLPR